MATKTLGKVSLTLGGAYNATAVYPRLTVVYGTDGSSYITAVDGVTGISPGVTAGWESYYQLLCEQPAPKDIQITQGVSSGTLLATITIDGTAYRIYAPNADAALSQSSTNAVQNQAVASAISGISSDVSTLSGNVSGVQGDVSALQTDVSEAQGDIRSLQALKQPVIWGTMYGSGSLMILLQYFIPGMPMRFTLSATSNVVSIKVTPGNRQDSTFVGDDSAAVTYTITLPEGVTTGELTIDELGNCALTAGGETYNFTTDPILTIGPTTLYALNQFFFTGARWTMYEYPANTPMFFNGCVSASVDGSTLVFTTHSM